MPKIIENACLNPEYEWIEKRSMGKDRRSLNTLHNLLLKTAETFPKKTVAGVIDNQPSVMDALIAKKGKSTKYWHVLTGFVQ